MTESFTQSDFEAALPRNKNTGAALFDGAETRMIQGEWAYFLHVGRPETGVRVMIRSSIGASGVCASTGEDSIRLFLVTVRDNDFLPLSCKLSTYVTRVPGWQGRLTEQARKLARLHKRAGFDSNGDPCKILKVKKEGANKGRLFASGANNHFEWLTDNKGNLLETI